MSRLAFHLSHWILQIFFGSKHIGGADALESLRKEGKLNVVLDKQRGSDGLPKALAIAAADALKQVLTCPST